MAFIPKNPISAPKSGTIPPIPEKGTRGIFPMSDGWYDIDDEGTVSKLGSGSGGGDVDLSGKEDKENKVKVLNESVLTDPETEEYPTTYATMSAIVEQSKSVENNTEEKLEFKEDKENKISEWKEDLSDEEYPSAKLVKEEVDTAKAMAEDGIGQASNAYLLADQALTEALAAGDAAETALVEIERQKGIIITGRGMPADATVEKLGQLYYDEDSTPPAVYVCAKINDESFEWLPVDVMGRDAWDYVTALYFDVTSDEGSIAQNYQRKWDKVTSITEESTDEQYPSALAVKSYVDSSMQSAILDSWEVAV